MQMTTLLVGIRYDDTATMHELATVESYAIVYSMSTKVERHTISEILSILTLTSSGGALPVDSSFGSSMIVMLGVLGRCPSFAVDDVVEHVMSVSSLSKLKANDIVD